jgi:predicted lactoylglutathione lyase
MSKMIFINLPVANLPQSKAFYEAIGFTNNPQFTNDSAAAMMWSDEIAVMLLTHDFWKTFTDKAIPNAHETAQVFLCLSHDSRESVDAIVAKAAAGGGRSEPTPTQDHGFMYGSSFEDPDGHIWENVYMDMAAVPAHPEPATA